MLLLKHDINVSEGGFSVMIPYNSDTNVSFCEVGMINDILLIFSP